MWFGSFLLLLGLVQFGAAEEGEQLTRQTITIYPLVQNTEYV